MDETEITEMKRKYTKEDLIRFEEEIKQCFLNKEIRSVLHLSNGNEDPILNVFDQIQPDDWVFATWRAHYQCLLKGVPWDQLKQDIIDGRSMALCYPQYRIFSSSIVGGVIPIANGVALDIKRKGLKNRVWCFVGDMTSEGGCFYENHKYAENFDLPITWVIENNKKSVCTDTYPTWGIDELSQRYSYNVLYYEYESKYPHAGVGQRIQF